MPGRRTDSWWGTSMSGLLFFSLLSSVLCMHCGTPLLHPPLCPGFPGRGPGATSAAAPVSLSGLGQSESLALSVGDPTGAETDEETADSEAESRRVRSEAQRVQRFSQEPLARARGSASTSQVAVLPTSLRGGRATGQKGPSAQSCRISEDTPVPPKNRTEAGGERSAEAPLQRECRMQMTGSSSGFAA